MLFVGGFVTAVFAFIFLGWLLLRSAATSEPPPGPSPSPAPATISDLQVVSSQAIEDKCKILEEELRPRIVAECKIAVLIMAAAAALRVSGHIDKKAALSVFSRFTRRLPESIGAQYQGLVARPPALEIIAAAALEERVVEDATGIICDVFGRDQATWSQAMRDFFQDWLVMTHQEEKAHQEEKV